MDLHGSEGGVRVIDYVIGNKVVRDRIERMQIGDNVDSDHHPVVIWIKGEGKRKRKAGGGGGKNKSNWSERGKKEYRERLGKVEVPERDR